MEGSGPIWNWDLMHDVFLLKEKWTSWNWVDIYMYMINACMYITWLQASMIDHFYTVDLLLLCECKWFAHVWMLRRLFVMNSCTAVESLDWSLEVHDATYANLLSIGPNLFSVLFKKTSPWCLQEPLRTPLIWSIPSKSYNHSFPFWERTKLLELSLCEVY